MLVVRRKGGKNKRRKKFGAKRKIGRKRSRERRRKAKRKKSTGEIKETGKTRGIKEMVERDKRKRRVVK